MQENIILIQGCANKTYFDENIYIVVTEYERIQMRMSYERFVRYLRASTTGPIKLSYFSICRSI